MLPEYRLHRARHHGSQHGGQPAKGRHALVVHDVRAAAEPHIAQGADWADTPRAVAEAAEVTFTSLPGPPEVEAVALGENGLLAGMRPDAAYFDLSTNSPTLVRRIHAAFAARGAHMLDAPVSGGPAGARSGRLALWVGGTEAIFQRHKAVLDAMGDQARYIGPTGAGSVAKLVHNCAGYAVQAALGEVFALGVRAGSIRWHCGRRFAWARSAAVAPSMRWPTSSCQARTIRRPSRCAWRTRTCRWQRNLVASWVCRCVSPTLRMPIDGGAEPRVVRSRPCIAMLLQLNDQALRSQ
jgi:hypothetical protein